MLIIIAILLAIIASTLLLGAQTTLIALGVVVALLILSAVVRKVGLATVSVFALALVMGAGLLAMHAFPWQ